MSLCTHVAWANFSAEGFIGGGTTGAQGARAPLKFSASGIIFREADIKLLADSDERPPLALDEPSSS